MAASKIYEQFVADLNNSQPAVLAVAGLLQRRGYEVVLPPHSVTPSEDERYQYLDAGDLAATRLFRIEEGRRIEVPPENRVRRTHQVKQSSRDFDSVAAFGFSMVTVDEDYKIEAQLARPPAAYWIVSRSRTGAIYIPWSTRPQWDVFRRVDPLQRGRVCAYIRCPARLCHYVSLDLSTPAQAVA